MLQRVFFCLLRRYCGITLLPAAPGCPNGEPLLIREAFIPLPTQFRHGHTVFAFSLPRLPSELASLGLICNAALFSLGIDNGRPAREFFNRGAINPGESEA